MARIDFGTVQVYQMADMVEVTFPFDRVFGDFLRSLKGTWVPQRKCWKVTSQYSNLSSDEIVAKISEYLERNAPKKWGKIMEILRGHGCVTTKFEVFAGLSGVRFQAPLGHPVHHYLKSVDGVHNNVSNKKQWLIPAQMFPDKVVQKSLARIYNDDEKRYREFIQDAEERCLVGEVSIPEADVQMFGLSKGDLVAVQRSFLETADPAMADLPAREIAMEVLSLARKSSDRIKIQIEYATAKEAYEFLKSRVYAENPARALDHAVLSEGKWIQRRA